MSLLCAAHAEPTPARDRLLSSLVLSTTLLLLAVSGCRAHGGMAGERAEEAERLHALAAEYWDWQMEVSPVWATLIGDRRFDDQLGDSSPEARAERLATLERFLADAERLDPSALGQADRVTHASLLDELRGALAYESCDLESWSIAGRSGPQVTFLNLAELQTVESAENARDLVARWEKMAASIDDQVRNLERGLDAGKVASRSAVEQVLGQLDALLARDPAQWELSAPAEGFAALGAQLEPGEAESLSTRLREAVSDDIRPAFERYRTFIRTRVLPEAREDTRPGLTFVEGGPECYRGLIRMYTSLELTAEEIHQIGLDELASLRVQMEALGSEALGVGELPALQERLRTDPALHFETREEILEKARRAVARAERAAPEIIGTVSEIACEVKPVPDYEAPYTTIAYYRRPSKGDGDEVARPGTYYVNTWAPATRPRYEAEVLAFHEAIPGHHTQLALALEVEGVPEFRRHTGTTAFVEGWGLYAERLADELGLYSGPLDRLGLLGFEAWRASRLVVDTGLHAMGWTRKQAIELMRATTLLAQNNIENEVDRYITTPGQALAYKLGQRELLALRAEAEARLGEAFDPRAFHDVVLANGPVSLSVLRGEVERWIEAHEQR